ncbi:peptidoglycan-recognition protein LA isoform X1 [Drosophila eugracilis]|uniref:peptidoglycan-recognition protein LA isoform X1 n=2 Tax=Drosophila eugracilis TaxID=29029 RepID=UPI001BDA0C39|nr:peptidoglycan-recognition protein LA isoform X1 [Drosophila eugracilis]XP_041673617.1 peptidoglycan-recognition protein LA isoform X1 [Drosophila eugracilis]
MFEDNSTPTPDNALWTLQGRERPSPAQRLHNLTSAAASSSSSGLPLPQNIFTNPAIQPSSVINLNHSTDVVIGPMTQYQGPVSIYYMDYMEAHAMQTAAGINSNNANGNGNANRNRDKSPSKRLTRNTILLITLILLVLATGLVVLYIELNRPRTELPSNKAIFFGNNYDHDTFPNLGNGHLVIDREQWGAAKTTPALTIPLKRPIPYVLITHIGVQSLPCENIYKCSIKMRTIQDSAIAEKGLPDIQSNFYVSDEGNIYVGRGWDWANTYANQTLAITFMGDYGRFKPSAKQMEGVQFLLAHAVANRNLEVDYKLVAQNQTKTTKSPGAYVYQEIRNWPHFYGCGMDEAPACGVELGMKPESWNAKQ